MPWRKLQLLKGKNSILRLPDYLYEHGISNVLIVTDKGIVGVGLMKCMLQSLEEQSIRYTIYDKTVPNPTIDNIEEAVKIYTKQNCEAIIGFGGSPIDCAKGIGAHITCPKKIIPQMKGMLKIIKNSLY